MWWACVIVASKRHGLAQTQVLFLESELREKIQPKEFYLQQYARSKSELSRFFFFFLIKGQLMNILASWAYVVSVTHTHGGISHKWQCKQMGVAVLLPICIYGQWNVNFASQNINLLIFFFSPLKIYNHSSQNMWPATVCHFLAYILDDISRSFRKWTGGRLYLKCGVQWANVKRGQYLICGAEWTEQNSEERGYWD